jgi:hypothetical protein
MREATGEATQGEASTATIIAYTSRKIQLHSKRAARPRTAAALERCRAFAIPHVGTALRIELRRAALIVIGWRPTQSLSSRNLGSECRVQGQSGAG